MRMVAIAALALFLAAFGGNNRAAAAPAADFGAETLALINSYRASRGLPPLASHAVMQALARQHSQHQASRRRMNHAGFEQRMAQARAAGLGGRCAENVGVRYQNAQQLFAGWRNSRVHNDNLLRPHLRTAGVAVVGAYSTFFAC